MIPFVYVQSVMLRLMRADQSAQDFVVARLILSRHRAQAIWDHAQLLGLRVFFPTSLREAHKTLKLVAAGLDRECSAFQLQAGGPNPSALQGPPTRPRAVVAVAAPEAEVGADGVAIAAPEEENHDAEDELRRRAQFFEQMLVRHFVSVGDSLEPIADLIDYWGPYIKIENRIAAEGNFQEVCSIPYDIVNDEVLRANTSSALSKARRKPSLLLATVAAKIKRALKTQDYRRYAQEQDDRVEEFCTMVDLDSSDLEVRQAAFRGVLPTILRGNEVMSPIFERASDDEAVWYAYEWLLKHFLKAEDPMSYMSAVALGHAVRTAVGVCRSELGGEADLAQWLAKMIRRHWFRR